MIRFCFAVFTAAAAAAVTGAVADTAGAGAWTLPAAVVAAGFGALAGVLAGARTRTVRLPAGAAAGFAAGAAIVAVGVVAGARLDVTPQEPAVWTLTATPAPDLDLTELGSAGGGPVDGGVVGGNVVGGDGWLLVHPDGGRTVSRHVVEVDGPAPDGTVTVTDGDVTFTGDAGPGTVTVTLVGDGWCDRTVTYTHSAGRTVALEHRCP